MIRDECGQSAASPGHQDALGLWAGEGARSGRSHGPVEIGQPFRIAAPAEMFGGIGRGALGKTIVEFPIGSQFPHGRGDAGGIGLVEHVGVDAGPQRRPEIGAGQDDGASDREKFRQLRGEAVVVERVGAAGLHKDIRQGHQRRQVPVMVDLAEGENVRSHFRRQRAEEIHGVEAGPQEHRRTAFAVQAEHGRVEFPHLGGVRRMGVPVIKDHGGVRRQAQCIPKFLRPGPGIKITLIRSRIQRQARSPTGDKLAELVRDNCYAISLGEQLPAALRMGQISRHDPVELLRRQGFELGEAALQGQRENFLLVVLEVDDQPSAGCGAHLFRELADIFPRGPGVDDVGAAAIGKDHAGFRLGMGDAAKTDRLMMGEGFKVMRHGHDATMTGPGEFIRQCGYVQGAIGGEAAVENKQDIQGAVRLWCNDRHPCVSDCVCPTGTEACGYVIITRQGDPRGGQIDLRSVVLIRGDTEGQLRGGDDGRTAGQPAPQANPTMTGDQVGGTFKAG